MKNKGFLAYVAGELVAVCLTLALVLVFAALVQLFTIGSSVITVVNQFLKTISVTVGAIVCIREKRGALKGALFGAIYAFITFLIFGLLAGGISFDKTLLFDLLFGLIIGAIAGVLSVNVKRKD